MPKTFARRRPLTLNGRSDESEENLERPEQNRIVRPTSATDGTEQTALISPTARKDVYLFKYGRKRKSRGKKDDGTTLNVSRLGYLGGG